MPLETRYYIYISDSKIEMLLPQVPQSFQEKIAAEIGFNTGLLNGKLKAERTTLDSRIARLKVIERHLLANEKIGSQEKRTSWIQGEMLARTVTLGNDGVIFIAETPRLLLGLAGSAHHVLGGARPQNVELPFSFLSRILDELNEWFRDRFERFPSVVMTDMPEERARLQYAPSGVSQNFDVWDEILPAAWKSASATEQRVQFLAKRLASKVNNEGQYQTVTTLATPLYVALSE